MDKFEQMVFWALEDLKTNYRGMWQIVADRSNHVT